MAEERMPVLDALRKGEEAAEDPLREIVRWTVQELLEAEVAAQIGAGRYESGADHPAQWLPRPHLGHAGRQPRAADSEVAPGELLPELVGAAAAGRAGAGGGGRGSVRPGGEHAEGGSARPGAGNQRHLAE